MLTHGHLVFEVDSKTKVSNPVIHNCTQNINNKKWSKNIILTLESSNNKMAHVKKIWPTYTLFFSPSKTQPIKSADVQYSKQLKSL